MLIQSFFEDLGGNLEYVLFKNADKLDRSIRGDFNFDISINPEHKADFFRVIKKWGLIEGVNIYDFMNKEVHHYYLFDINAVFHLHVHFGLILGTSYVKDVHIQTTDDFYTEYKKIDFIRVLNRKNAEMVRDYRSIVKGRSLLGRMYIFLLKKEKTKVDGRIKSRIKKELVSKSSVLKFAGVKNLYALLLKFLQTLVFGRGKGKKFYPGGKSIAIVGTDGSGKSTITGLLSKKLESIFYVKHFSFGRIAPIEAVNSSQRNKKLNGIRKCYTAYKRLAISYKMKVYSKLGYIVILDRYYNLNGPGMDSNKLEGGSFWGWIERGVYGLIRPVDLVFRLEIPLSIAIERNQIRSKLGKETDDEIEERYNLFAGSLYHSDKTVVIKNTKEASYAIDLILSELI